MEDHVVNQKGPLPDGEKMANNIGTMTRGSPSLTSGQKPSHTPSGRQGLPNSTEEKRLPWYARIEPGSLGCMLFMLALGMLIVFLAQDLPQRFTNKQSDTLATPMTGVTSTPVSVVAPTPTPESSLVILGTYHDGTNGMVYYFDSPTGVFRLDAQSGERLPVATLAGFEAFHWSPQGDKLAFVVHDRNDVLPLLYILDLSAPPPDSKLTLVSRRDPDGFPADFGLRAESPLAWSPFEEYIAFVAYDATGKAALFASKIATGEVTRLTEGSEPVTSVGWETYIDAQNVKGERIVYVLVRDGKERVYYVEKNGADNGPWGQR